MGTSSSSRGSGRFHTMNGIRPAVECRIGPTIRTNDSMSQAAAEGDVSAKTGETPRRASSRVTAAPLERPRRDSRDLIGLISPMPAELHERFGHEFYHRA